VSEYDELGAPISWRVLEQKTPVYADGGAAVGIVRHVMAIPESDIFEGIVIHTHDGDRFVPAESIAAMHEHAVALSLDAGAVAALERPQPGPAAMTVDADTLTAKHLTSLSSLAGDTWNRLTGR
jgi:hypothetical protein